jgi:hypothetical protein
MSFWKSVLKDLSCELYRGILNNRVIETRPSKKWPGEVPITKSGKDDTRFGVNKKPHPNTKPGPKPGKK